MYKFRFVIAAVLAFAVVFVAHLVFHQMAMPGLLWVAGFAAGVAAACVCLELPWFILVALTVIGVVTDKWVFDVNTSPALVGMAWFIAAGALGALPNALMAKRSSH